MPGDDQDWRPINPAEVHGPRNGALPAYVSNGLIGLRVREMALAPGMTLVNGVAGEHPERRIEAAHGGTDGRRLFEGLVEALA